VSCRHCGKPIGKGEKFILIGTYPSHWSRKRIVGGSPEKFGEMYHEACYPLQMRGRLCVCGHPKSEHGEIVWVKPEKEGEKAIQRWVAKGQGTCMNTKCSCPEFREKE